MRAPIHTQVIHALLTDVFLIDEIFKVQSAAKAASGE